MYFAPSLEDLCIRWRVPPRTAAALFVAMANGAPDLASTSHMIRLGAFALRSDQSIWHGNNILHAVCVCSQLKVDSVARACGPRTRAYVSAHVLAPTSHMIHMVALILSDFEVVSVPCASARDRKWVVARVHVATAHVSAHMQTKTHICFKAIDT